ncbi:MAG: hypothetical protein ACI35S_10030 [Anaeroplasma sp.]
MIGIIKGDERFTYLHSLIDNSILSNKLEDFYNIDVLILPFKAIDENNIIQGSLINIMDLFKNNSIKYIITGNSNKWLKNLCNKYDIHLIELLKNSQFVRENAFLTAKGIISYFTNNFIEPSNHTFLLIGYGNITYYLASLLDAYKTNYYVMPTNELEEKYLLLKETKISDLKCDCDIIINTVPSNLEIDYTLLKDKTIIDVASYPYGFNPILIDENNINYKIISAIPAKYFPLSSALLIKKYINLLLNR